MVDIASDLVGEFKGGLVVGAFEGKVLLGSDLAEDVVIRFLWRSFFFTKQNHHSDMTISH